jgi:IMP dehydrogenase/GMP reductase
MSIPLFDFDDILIEPVETSYISSRKEITSTHTDGMLPLMTAPMDTVVDLNNYMLYQQNRITTVLFRGIKNIPEDYDGFISFGLDEFIVKFLHHRYPITNDQPIKVLIDVANGHMDKLYETAISAKNKYSDSLLLMVGNVANPYTFERFCKVGIDYVRIGIGNGNGCLTTVQTGVGYPMGSLIERCSDIKKVGFYHTKIVADGGFKKYSDIIKALALGADYVMLGSIFNKSLESAGETKNKYGVTIDQYSELTKEKFEADIPYYKHFRGMSTKEVQQEWGKSELTTSEGVVRTHNVEYTLSSWVTNFEDYLKSAMSYTGKNKLHRFIGEVNYNMITESSFKRFNK